MADAKQMADWDQVSTMWTLIANANRDPKHKPQPFQPWDIHPYRSIADYQPQHADLSGLRDLVQGAKNGEKC